jgi:hypothetical protein
MATWLFGSAAPACSASWELILEAILTKEFFKTRDCQGNRGFCVLTTKRKKV